MNRFKEDKKIKDSNRGGSETVPVAAADEHEHDHDPNLDPQEFGATMCNNRQNQQLIRNRLSLIRHSVHQVQSNVKTKIGIDVVAFVLTIVLTIVCSFVVAAHTIEVTFDVNGFFNNTRHNKDLWQGQRRLPENCKTKIGDADREDVFNGWEDAENGIGIRVTTNFVEASSSRNDDYHGNVFFTGGRIEGHPQASIVIECRSRTCAFYEVTCYFERDTSLGSSYRSLQEVFAYFDSQDNIVDQEVQMDGSTKRQEGIARQKKKSIVPKKNNRRVSAGSNVKSAAIIPDGNRRWTKKDGLPSFEGRKEATRKSAFLTKNIVNTTNIRAAFNMKLLASSVGLLAAGSFVYNANGPNTDDTPRSVERQLPMPYYVLKRLGALNYNVTIGNPMKGLIGNPFTNDPKNWPKTLPATIHHYKLALDDVMRGDPDVVGPLAFDWTSIDEKLKLARKYNSHAVFRFFVHWPGKPLFIPSYLLREPYKVQTVWHNNEVAPYYGDTKLRRAFEQFIDHFARRYDGDPRLFAIQAGLIGAWGEWQSNGCKFNGENCDTDQSKREAVQAYAKYWKKTKIQFRYPERKDAEVLGFGFHDDSYTLETVSGPANGGVQHTYFFWNSSMIHGTTNFWRRAPSSGEVRPENQNIFDPRFPSGTAWHQDPMVCVQIAHTTFVDWGRGFANDNGVQGVTGAELSKAQFAHARMGYNFQLIKLAVSSPSPDKVSIDATIKQVGFAPFYYPLYLDLYCEGVKRANNFILGDLLTDKGKTTVVSLKNIPSTSACLRRVELRLDSTYLYPERPIKWAQGSTGKVVVTIPLPGSKLWNENIESGLVSES